MMHGILPMDESYTISNAANVAHQYDVVNVSISQSLDIDYCQAN